jgi:protoporphyrinogen oxidase
MRDEKVVIIGSGPGGLAAAYELIGQGIRPVVVETADNVGGIARTEIYKGYHFDIGGHRFFSKNEKIDQLWKQMLGEDFLKVTRMSRIYYRGRFFRYPLSLANTLLNLGVIESLLILLSYLKVQVAPFAEEETFEQWVTNRFGKRLYRTFFQTYTEKLWGIRGSKIRADWAAQRIKGLSLAAAVTDTLLGNNKTKSLINEFRYPLKGPGMMWQRFHQAIEAKGGQVHLNSEVIELNCKKGAVTSVKCARDGETLRLPVEHLISGMPITALVELIKPRPPEKVLQAARHLAYRAFIIVGLIIDRKDLFPDQWIYVHSPEVKVGRIQNFKNWSAAMVPDHGKTSIGMEYFCNEGDAVWTTPDAELIDLASHELDQLGLADTDAVIDGVVIRQPGAYPVYDHKYSDHLQVIREFIGSIDNLQTIGRNGMHRYNNMDHSMFTGMLAAQNLLGSNHDLWAVNEEAEYLEADKKTKTELIDAEKILMRGFALMDKLSFATAIGSVSGLLVFLATIWLVIKGGPVVGPNLQLLAQYFVGYTVTVKGAFIAFGYSFCWGFLLGWLYAYLRNFLLSYYIYRIRRSAELRSFRDFMDRAIG